MIEEKTYDVRTCPFCGGLVIVIDKETYENLGDKEFFAWCVGCGARGPSVDEEQAAADSWNRREPDWERKWGELVETVSARTDQARTMEVKP